MLHRLLNFKIMDLIMNHTIVSSAKINKSLQLCFRISCLLWLCYQANTKWPKSKWQTLHMKCENSTLSCMKPLWFDLICLIWCKKKCNKQSIMSATSSISIKLGKSCMTKSVTLNPVLHGSKVDPTLQWLRFCTWYFRGHLILVCNIV